jgi:hypothetical protein
LITAAAVAQNQQGTGKGIPVAIGICLGLVAAWYLLRALALRWEFARLVVRRLSPHTRRMHVWVISAPATFAYIAIFTASTIVQRTEPPQLVNLLTSVDSTSLSRLKLAPLSALADSAVWVANQGAGLMAYVVAFATVVAYAERRYGTPRIIVICLAGHVFGTLLTARVELHAIRAGLAPPSLAVSTDVGVSYIMVAGLAAAVLVMRRRWQLIGGLALAAGVIAPVFVSHTVWDLGHLFATLCGLAAAALTLLAAPPRPVPWRPPWLPRDAGGEAGHGARGPLWPRRAGASLARAARAAPEQEKGRRARERADPGDPPA